MPRAYARPKMDARSHWSIGVMGKRPSEVSWHAGTVNWAGLTLNCGKLGWFDSKLTDTKYLASQNKHLVTT
jgi:hypothetical protein